MTVAIITGASSGLGKEFVDAVINEFPDIDEIWLVARRKERLEEIARQHPQKTCKVIGLDLSKDESITAFGEILAANKPDIKLLISNSAIAHNGNFGESTLQHQITMCDLNVKGSTAITHLCLPYMNSGSIILETCSVSAFAPNPGLLVYSSTKAYLLSFCKGLRAELKPRGINVCAVCPGNMATEMLTGVQSGDRRGVSDYLPILNIQKVAAKSLIKAKQGKAVYTPGAFYKFYRLLAKMLPHKLIMRFSRM